MFEIILLAIGLALDTFSVAAGFGTGQKGHHLHYSLRMAIVFGLSHILAILGGWFAGSLVSGPLGAVDHWLAFLLLAYVGVKMLQSGLGTAEKAATHLDVSSLRTLGMLSIATALDAVAVGASLALIHENPVPLALTTGVVVFILVMVGVNFGRRVGALLGHRSGIAGGLVLLAIGVKILHDHGVF